MESVLELRERARDSFKSSPTKTMKLEGQLGHCWLTCLLRPSFEQAGVQTERRFLNGGVDRKDLHSSEAVHSA